jgi:hypothetical protein
MYTAMVVLESLALVASGVVMLKVRHCAVTTNPIPITRRELFTRDFAARLLLVIGVLGSMETLPMYFEQKLHNNPNDGYIYTMATVCLGAFFYATSYSKDIYSLRKIIGLFGCVLCPVAIYVQLTATGWVTQGAALVVWHTIYQVVSVLTIIHLLVNQNTTSRMYIALALTVLEVIIRAVVSAGNVALIEMQHTSLTIPILYNHAFAIMGVLLAVCRYPPKNKMSVSIQENYNQLEDDNQLEDV